MYLHTGRRDPSGVPLAVADSVETPKRREALVSAFADMSTASPQKVRIPHEVGLRRAQTTERDDSRGLRRFCAVV